ncbi:MAG TPA: VIT domain-containing protein [Polyangiaceae bacterium]|nr:VIT domain-containing protein [Polyangiaceae bacterium]
MKRACFLLLGFVLLACSKGAPSRAIVPPWQWVVTGMRPGSVAAEPALVVCEANGSGCGPVKPGVKLGGGKLVRLERGVSEFELDSGTRIEVGEGSELLVQDAPRTIELRAGGIVLTRADAVADAGPLTVKMVDRTLLLPGRASIVARMDNLSRGELFVSRGLITTVEPPGAPVPARQFHAGEGAVFEKKAPPNLQALFAGQVSRFRQAVLAVVDTPPPPKTVIEPRGLGTMTARVPGTTTVVEGVRLAQHHVRAVVRDSVAQTEVEEVFQNDGDRVLEGRYVFPLPPDASITGLTLFVNDKPVDGELVEKKRAAAIFKGIVEDTVRPRDPALLEWVKGSQFSLKVFPLPAHGSRKVILRYQQVLTSDGPRQAYVYPLSFGAERRTAIDELSIDVDLSDGGAPAQGVVPSGYAATVASAGKATHVALRASRTAPDHDFAISFARPAPGALVGTNEGGFVAMRLRAELPPDAGPPAFQARDRVLVLDASGSQSSESLAASRELMLDMLRGLEPDERFAVLVCDSACESVPKTGVTTATGQVFDEAVALVKARKPAGSSDIAGALRAAAERVPAGAAVQVVYLGDGSPSAGELSAASIAARVRSSFEQRKVDLRLFGVGSSIDEVTLTGLARALSGSYDNVSSAGALSEQAEVLTTGLRAPLLVAPILEVPADVAELEPRTLPNLRLGEEFVVVGKRTSSAPFNITLRGRLNGAAYALPRSIGLESTPGSLPFAARLWAAARVRELEASGDASVSKELVELSRQFRVMSRETSWLVLENEQMFAEFGIARSAPPSDVLSGDAGRGADRGALSQELDQLQLGTLAGAASGSNAADDRSSSARDTSSPAKSGAAGPKAEAEEPSRSAPAPASPPVATPAPSPAAGAGGAAKPGSAGGGLSGSGSSGGLGGIGSGAGSGSQIVGMRGNATVGGAAVAGGNVSNAARVIAGMRAGFRACYQRGLNEDPNATGSIRLTIKVGPGGEVVAVTPAPAGQLPASVIACVVARARAAQFAPPDSGSPVIAVPITFTSTLETANPNTNPLPTRPLFTPPPDDTAVTRAGDETWQAQGQAALDKLQADVAANPSSRKRQEALVRGLLLRGRFAPALTAAEHFVELDPDLPVARELLAYAAVATGDRQRATAAIDALTEAGANDLKSQGRAARAFEALGDEARACAHWRSVLELAPTSDSARFEALRCRARVMGDRDAALADAKAVPKPGPLLAKLLPQLESGQVPSFEKSSGSAGQFEVTLRCEAGADCPYAIVITPTGTVFSPWTPALGRSSPTSFAFSGLMTGLYRVLLIGGAPSAKGQVEVRALNARNTFNFTPGHAPTVAITQVTMAPVGLGGLGNIGVLSRF